MSRGINFVEGEVDDINVDIAGYQRIGAVTLRYITIRLKLSEDRYIDVRFKGYTGPVTIIRGHKVKAYGNWLKENIFRATRIEDLTTGEWWEAKSIKPVYLLLIGLAVFLIVFIILLINMASIFSYYPEDLIAIVTVPFIIILMAIIYTSLRFQKSFKIVS